MKKRNLLSLATLFAVSAVFAQEAYTPFSHLSAAIEIGTTGVGLQVATPINNMFGIRAGYTFVPNIGVNPTINYSIPDARKMDEIINDPGYAKVKEDLIKNNLPISSSDLPTSTVVNGDIGMSNGKLLLDFFPIKNHSFHVSAGIYIGNSKLVKASGGVPSELIGVVEVLDKYKSEYGYTVNTDVTFGGTSFSPKELQSMQVDGAINTVKPYIGIGFGRPIPKKRIGCQFEIGAMYAGKASVTANTDKLTTAINNELKSTGDDKYLSYSTIYPMISFKLVGRIF